MKEYYLKYFEMALKNGFSDYQLELIINEASEKIEDNNEYYEFYCEALKMYK